MAFVMLSVTACDAQIKNAKNESVKIYGNCGMCESTIEKAGNIKKVVNVDWDKEKTKHGKRIYAKLIKNKIEAELLEQNYKKIKDL